MEAAKIEIIQKYLSVNGVEYYDVQAELIDHFATTVEETQKQNPGLSFTDAMMKAHRNFGGKEGFRKYLEQAQTDVNKKIYKLLGKTLLRFVQWPYLVITAALALSWYLVFTKWNVPTDILFVSMSTTFLLVMIWNVIRMRNVKMFLPKKAYKALGLVFYFVVYLPGVPLVFTPKTPSTVFNIIYFTLLSLMLVAFSKIPKLSIEETQKIYPQISI